MRIHHLVLACLVVLIPSAVFAQAGAQSPPVTSAPVVTHLVDSIPAAASAAAALPSARPMHSTGWSATRKGVVIGASVGLISGLLVGGALCEERGCIAEPVFYLGVAGAAIGAGVGSLIDSGWESGGFPRGIRPAMRSRVPRVSVNWRF